MDRKEFLASGIAFPWRDGCYVWWKFYLFMGYESMIVYCITDVLACRENGLSVFTRIFIPLNGCKVLADGPFRLIL
jgi:hypothetical protein